MSNVTSDSTHLTTSSIDGLIQSNPIYEDLPNTASMLGVGLITLMLILGVFGNILLITSIILSPQLRKIPNAFILHLAVIHLLYVLVNHSIILAVYIRQKWLFSAALIVVYHSTGMCLQLLNVASIIIVAYIRYFRLLKPDLYKTLMKPPSFLLLVAIMYVLSASITGVIIQLTVNERHSLGIKATLFSPKFMMAINAEEDTFLIPVVLCAGAAVFLMLYVYANVHLVVHNSVRVSVPNFETDHRDMVLRQRKDLLKKELVYIKAIMIVFVFYILTLLQFQVIYEIDRKQSFAPVNLCVISVVTYGAPFCLTWFILGAVSPAFRDAYLTVLVLRCSSLRIRIFPHVASDTGQPQDGAYPDINILPPSVSQGLDSHAEIVEYLAALTAIKRPNSRNLSPQAVNQNSTTPASRASSRTLELNYLEDLERASSASTKGVKVTCEHCQMPFTITTVTPQPSTSANVKSFTECETCRGGIDTVAVHCQTGPSDGSQGQGAPYPYTAWNSEDVSFESVV